MSYPTRSDRCSKVACNALAFAGTLSLTLLSLSPAMAEKAACPQLRATAQPTLIAQSTQTIPEIAVANGNFKTLVQALQAAGLVDTLAGQGPFTVFAPTDAAFAALPPGTLDQLLKPENREVLKKVLTYHVVAGDLQSQSLKSGEVKTVEGNEVMVKVKDGKVKVNNANVVTADVSASNGVIHVIDRVILPPDLQVR